MWAFAFIAWGQDLKKIKTYFLLLILFFNFCHLTTFAAEEIIETPNQETSEQKDPDKELYEQV